MAHQRPSDARAREVYQRRYKAELKMLRSQPEMRVKPHGAFGDYYRVGECTSDELEAVARRNVERAVERALRSQNATTEA